MAVALSGKSGVTDKALSKSKNISKEGNKDLNSGNEANSDVSSRKNVQWWGKAENIHKKDKEESMIQGKMTNNVIEQILKDGNIVRGSE